MGPRLHSAPKKGPGKGDSTHREESGQLDEKSQLSTDEDVYPTG